jgi:hypothetical protein
MTKLFFFFVVITCINGAMEAPQKKYSAAQTEELANRMRNLRYTHRLDIEEFARKISNLVISGADPNVGNASALRWALGQKNENLIQLLVDHGTRISSFVGTGRPIIKICFVGYPESIAKILVDGLLREKDADINETNAFGTTPLILSIEINRDLTEFLISRGADIDMPDKKGNTALIIATCCQRADKIKLLLDHGADPSIKNLNNKTARDVAMSINGDLFKMLSPQKLA